MGWGGSKLGQVLPSTLDSEKQSSFVQLGNASMFYL